MLYESWKNFLKTISYKFDVEKSNKTQIFQLFEGRSIGELSMYRAKILFLNCMFNVDSSNWQIDI